MNKPSTQHPATFPVVHLFKLLNAPGNHRAQPLAKQSALKVVQIPVEERLSDWLELQNQAFGRGSRRPWQEADFQRELASRDWYPRSPSLLAIRDDCLLGAVTLELPSVGASTARIHWLATAADHRRRGIARLLVESCERECERRGIDRIEIETLREWNSAMRFYEAIGFQPCEQDISSTEGNRKCER